MNDREVYWAHEAPEELVNAINKPSIKDIVKDNKVHFVFYRQQHMYYEICCCPDGQKYTFPVPLEDVMDASLFAQEKAITYMRYIRKALEAGTFVVSGCC